MNTKLTNNNIMQPVCLNLIFCLFLNAAIIEVLLWGNYFSSNYILMLLLVESFRIKIVDDNRITCSASLLSST